MNVLGGADDGGGDVPQLGEERIATVCIVVERNSIELVEGVIHADLQLWR